MDRGAKPRGRSHPPPTRAASTKRLLAVSFCVLAGFIFACVLFVASVSVRTASGAGGVSNGDVNGDGQLDVSDAVYMLVHLFKGGQQPVACADTPELVARVAALEGTDARLELAATCAADKRGPERFVLHGDGTVTDPCSGLTWTAATVDGDGDAVPTTADRVPWVPAHTLPGPGAAGALPAPPALQLEVTNAAQPP